MLIKSIVDITKVSRWIISNEIEKVLAAAGKSRDESGNLVYENPHNKLLEEVCDCKDLYGGVTALLEMISKYRSVK